MRSFTEIRRGGGFLRSLAKSAICCAVIVSLSTVAGCSDDYDDSQLRGDLSELSGRVEKLEQSVAKLNGDYTALSGIVDALEGKVYVSKVDPIADGYRITFSDGTTAEIKNGAAGAAAPVIGIDKDTDGLYYWTRTIDGKTEWLLNEENEKMPVSGVTPVMGVDAEGYWTISYDGGTTSSRVVDSEGNPLPGFRLTLTGNNTETEYIAGYKAQDCTNPDGSGGFTKAPITDLRLQVEGPGRTVEYTWSGAEADVLPDTTQLVWRYDTLDSLMREAPVLDLQFVPSDGEEPHRTDLKIWCENAPEEMSGLLASSEDTSWVSTDNNARFRLVFPRMDADAMKGLRFCYQAEYRVKLPEGGGYAYRAEGTLTADSRTLTAEIPLERED